MVTQGVISEASKYFESGSLSQISQKTSSQGNNFNDVMNKNLDSKAPKTVKTGSTGKDVSQKDSPADDKHSADSVKNDSPSTPDTAKTDTSDKEVKSPDEKTVAVTTDSPKTEDDVKGLKNLKTIMDVIMKNLSSMNNSIKTVVKDTLQISDEELEKIMSQLGLQMTDLLQPENLKKLVLAANGTNDASSFLTNETMTSQFTQLADQLEKLDLSSQFGVSKEELSKLLETANQQLQPVIQKESMPVNQKDQQSNLFKDDAKTKDEPVITVSVEKNDVGKSLQKDSVMDSGNDRSSAETETNKQSPLDTFAQNLITATQQNTDDLSPQLDKITQMKEIMTQIVDKIKVVIKPEATSMEMQLNPENLGRVSLSVVSKNGQLTAHFTTETQMAKEALESQMQTLKENLSNQGLKVDAVEVNVSNFTFSQSNQPESGTKEQKSSSKKHNHIKDVNFSEDTYPEEDEATNQAMEQNGSSINYTA